MQSELVEVVVVTYNSARHIRACIESIAAEGAFPVVVDNNSTDDTLEIVRLCCPEAKIIASDKNQGYGKAMNAGFRETKSDFVILSNPDVVFLDGSIARLAEFLTKNPRVGVTGPQQIFPDRSWQRSYGNLPGIWAGIKDAIGITSIGNWTRRVFWPRRIDRNPKEVPYLDGGILMARREAIEYVEGFDEEFFFYGEESDLCARLRKAKWGVVFYPLTQVIHARGGSSIQVDSSDAYVTHMVNSQSKLARKYLSPWQARFYLWLQRIHFQRLALTYGLLRIVLKEPKASQARARVQGFHAYLRVLQEHMEADSVVSRHGK
jgi:GT2 family glycosyltransferase